MDPGVSLGARLSFRSETAGAFLRPTGFQDSRIGVPTFAPPSHFSVLWVRLTASGHIYIIIYIVY